MTCSPPTSVESILERVETQRPSSEPLSGDSSRVNYYGRSFGDPRSRLFWKDGDLWMGLLAPHGREFAELLESTLLAELQEARLLPRLLRSEEPIPGFESIYEFEESPRIVYWHEWSPTMWQTAVLRLIELLEKLAKQQLTLRNPHPWNLLYDGRKFFFANPGSIVPLDADTFARSYEKVARFFVRPLVLLTHGFGHIAQRLTADPRDGVLAEDVMHIETSWAEWETEAGAKSILPFLDNLWSEVGSMKCIADPERWINYFETDCDFSAGTSWSRKQEALEAFLKDKEIRSVIDLGANTGHYARIAAESGREVIATDFDSALVDRIFAESRSVNLSLFPAVLDFAHPTPGQGVAGAWFPPATERLSADLVLCFALTHHMVFGKYRLDFEQVARGVRGFSRKWALVEYVERGKIQPAEWRPDADLWYTVEHLATALRRHFQVVDILPPANDGRRLLVCGPERRAL